MVTRRITSFPPIANPDAKILILGSMPGVKSLEAAQYYAHPRNDFWKIIGAMVGFDPLTPYVKRQAALQQANIAVWDVLQSCIRQGSLDSAIKSKTSRANNFADFFRQHPHITRVCFNGATAERYYRTLVLPTLHISSLEYRRLPSTSPAHAVTTLEKKLQAWREGILR